MAPSIFQNPPLSGSVILVNEQPPKPVDPMPSPTVGDSDPALLHQKALDNPFGGRQRTRWKWDHKRYSASYGPLGIEITDNETGQVVAASKTLAGMGASLEDMASKAIEVTLEDGQKILVDPAIPTSDLHNRISPKHRYTPVLCELICNLVAQGKTVHEIAGMAGMPSTMTIRKWRNDNLEFDKLWRLALQDYAELKAHNALTVAEEAHKSGNPDFVPGAKLFVDTLKWASEKSDPDKFGTKTKISGEVKHSISLVVDTGIRRAEDQGYIQAAEEAQLVEEEKDHGLLPPIVEKHLTTEAEANKEPVVQDPVSHEDLELKESMF